MIDGLMLPALRKFVKDAPSPAAAEQRRDRLRLCFGEGGLPGTRKKCWSATNFFMKPAWCRNSRRDGGKDISARPPELGTPMIFDHRRILATAIARLRGKLKYRPVVFELMAPSFTLLELQRTVEALVGRPAAQAEFPPPGRRSGPGGRHRKILRPSPGPAGGTVPLPPRSAARTAGARACGCRRGARSAIFSSSR